MGGPKWLRPRSRKHVGAQADDTMAGGDVELNVHGRPDSIEVISLLGGHHIVCWRTLPVLVVSSSYRFAFLPINGLINHLHLLAARSLRVVHGLGKDGAHLPCPIIHLAR